MSNALSLLFTESMTKKQIALLVIAAILTIAAVGLWIVLALLVYSKCGLWPSECFCAFTLALFPGLPTIHFLYYQMSYSRECMGVNGEALQLHAVYKKYFLLLRESISVLQVT